MVIRSSVVAVPSRLTRLVVFTGIFLLVTIGSREIDGQVQAPAPSQQENRGSAHLKLMEDSVRQLASSIQDVYPNTCDDLVSCDICTQDECLPVIGIQTCANVSHNTRCNEHYPTCSASIWVTMERSSTAYPRESLGSKPDYAQTRTICGTTGLDATFKVLYKRNPYHAEYYVGFPDGTRRSYPGREEADPTSLYPCTDYDCRVRPWYNAAIFQQNHLVILVDSRTESLDASYLEKSDTLTFAKKFAKKLLGAVNENDWVNVVPFSSAAEANALVTESVRVTLNNLDPQNHTELEPLKQELDKLRAAPDDVQVTSSNLTAGLQQALSLIRSVHGTRSKNVIVFTNGDISYDSWLNMTLDQIPENLVRLFIFSMNTDDKLRNLDAVAERARGAHIRLTTSINPEYQLRSYYSYMADLQVRSNRTTPLWTTSYRDYYDIGEIITVVAPAFSNEPRRLLGVAAVDVLYLEIGDILEDFKTALRSRAEEVANITEDIFRSMTVYDDSSTDSCDIKRADNVMCKPDKEIDPQQNFLDRFCCSRCLEGSPSDISRILLITIPSVILGPVFLIVLSLVAIRTWRSRRPSQRVQGDSGVQEVLSPPIVRKSSVTLQLASPRTKKEDTANAGSGTPRQIHHSSVRFGVEKFTSPLQEAKPAGEVKQ